MITFNNIVERFKVFADAHFFVKSFSFGSPDDVDLSKFTNFPLMHLVYTGATYDAGTKTYNLEVYILDVPADKTKKTDRQKEVVSDAEQCAEDIIADIKNGGNIFLFAQDYEVVNATTTPLEEETKNVLSGVLLDLSVAIPYEWDACNAPIDGVSPEGGDEVAYARRGILRMLTQDGSTDVLSVRTIKVTNGTLTDDGDGVVTLDTGGASTLGELDDVEVDDPSVGQSIMWDSGSGGRWVKDSRTTILYEEFKQGLETTVKNGAGTESELKLEQTKATVQTGITKVVLTETSPGDIEFVVATDADGNTAFTALHLDGSSTANVADLLVKFGTYFKFEAGNFTQWVRPNLSVSQDTIITLPSKSGVLGLAEDIPTSVTNLDDVTSAGSGAIITDAERTKLEGVAPSATANETDAFLLDRANHTGTQAASTISDFDTEVSNNTDVAANTAKVGITTQQADDITANNAKVSLIAGGTTGQALVKSTGTDYDVEWADIAVDVQYHDRYASEAETLLDGATETVELYYTAQADGDGLSESASSDTPTSGYDIQRKLWYAEKAQADPDTSADWTQFTAIADNTTFNNAKAALLAYLKERTGGTVPISLKMTWEEVAQAPAFTGLLNESYGSGAAAAYSVRRLNGLYTGAAIQVERSSDNTTQDIGFDVDGNLDESALTTFCTGTTCKVRTWYDQSVTGGTGSGNDAQQTDHTKQPTIYTGGAIVKENGRVSLRFDGSQVLESQSVPSMDNVPLSIYNTVIADTTGNGSFVTTGFASNQTTDTIWAHIIAGGNHYAELKTYPAGSIKSVNTGVAPTDFALISINANTDLEVWKNSTTIGSTSLAGFTSGAVTKTILIGDSHSNVRKLTGNVSESIVYGSSKSTTDRTSIESNIGDYFTQNTPLLDTYSGAAAAYSLRLLDSSYVGSAVEVYNGSSYADIGFNVFGELDTVALAAHCGSNDGFVSKWYDQSGNSNDATQTTTANMPKIYDGTTGVVTENGKPALEFDGSNDAMYSGLISSSTEVSISAVHKNPHKNDYDVIIGVGNNDGYALTTEANKYNLFYRAVADQSTTNETHLNDTQSLIFAYTKSATSQILHLNGVEIQNITPATMTAPTTSTAIGTYDDSTQNRDKYNGQIQEIVVWASNQSSNRTNIEDNINTFYDIYS